jgi:hypothetical protein
MATEGGSDGVVEVTEVMLSLSNAAGSQERGLKRNLAPQEVPETPLMGMPAKWNIHMIR